MPGSLDLFTLQNLSSITSALDTPETVFLILDKDISKNCSFSEIDSTWNTIFILTCIECRARSSVNIRDHYKYKWFTANSSYEESFKEVFIVIPDISTRMRPQFKAQPNENCKSFQLLRKNDCLKPMKMQ